MRATQAYTAELGQALAEQVCTTWPHIEAAMPSDGKDSGGVTDLVGDGVQTHCVQMLGKCRRWWT